MPLPAASGTTGMHMHPGTGLGRPLGRRGLSHCRYSKAAARHVDAQTSVSFSVSPATLSCPRCGAGMVRRMARRGRNAGSSFWGCSRYPNVQRHPKRLSAVLDRLSRGHTLATPRLISIISPRAHRHRLCHDASLRVNMITSWPTVSTFVTWQPSALADWRRGPVSGSFRTVSRFQRENSRFPQISQSVTREANRCALPA
jgi:hypothetical protein